MSKEDLTPLALHELVAVLQSASKAQLKTAAALDALRTAQQAACGQMVFEFARLKKDVADSVEDVEEAIADINTHLEKLDRRLEGVQGELALQARLEEITAEHEIKRTEWKRELWDRALQLVSSKPALVLWTLLVLALLKLFGAEELAGALLRILAGLFLGAGGPLPGAGTLPGEGG